jgi:hypothetical protein
MAKKKTVTNKKELSAKKNISSAAKKPLSAKKAAPSSDVTALGSGIYEQLIPLLPASDMEDIIGGVKSNMSDFEDITKSNLTTAQRRRKIGPGTQNYGFVDKVSDLAEVNLKYTSFFGITNLKNCIRNVETCRDLAIALLAFYRIATNAMLIYSDDAYSMALIFYNLVKEMSRQGDPVAIELYRDLKTHFKKKKRGSDEPTEMEIERDARALLHGKKDGRIVIENITPKKTSGLHKVVDETFKGKAAFKETDEGGIDE